MVELSGPFLDFYFYLHDAPTYIERVFLNKC